MSRMRSLRLPIWRAFQASSQAARSRR